MALRNLYILRESKDIPLGPGWKGTGEEFSNMIETLVNASDDPKYDDWANAEFALRKDLGDEGYDYKMFEVWFDQKGVLHAKYDSTDGWWDKNTVQPIEIMTWDPEDGWSEGEFAPDEREERAQTRYDAGAKLRRQNDIEHDVGAVKKKYMN